ncbi:MAG: TonB-dependent receptor, partial [Gammaproteobacteria bacterium]|nr:TonB-dependent receptor [Gammaproteobacteria bacterium]
MNRPIIPTLLILFTLALLGVAEVQAQVTSAAAAGRVLDASGVGIEGASVELIHEPSGTRRSTTTDSEGRYSVRGLRVGGPYRVVARREGYRPGVLSEQYLQLSEAAAIDVTLESSRVTEELVVLGTRVGGVFDPSRMGTGTIVDRDRIEGLPSIQRNIQDYVRTDPRISQVDKQRGEISAGGQNTRFNNIRIDGVSTNDAFGLESNNLPTDRQPITMDSIESINISLVNFDTALAGYTGASIDAVTRSGTNDFEGSLYYIYRDNDWTGKRDGSRFTGFEDEKTIGLTFGGPIIQDTLFFFGSYEKFTRSSAAPVFGPAGSGAGQEVSGISQADLDEVRSIAQNVWGFDAGDFAPPGSLDTDIEDLLIKIDWNINDYHRANIRYNRTKQDDPNLRGIGARSLSLSSYWDVSNKEFESFVAQAYSDWTENFSTEVKISYAEQSALFSLGSELPQIQICLNSSNCSGSDNIFLGTERFRHVNQLETETWNVLAAANYTTGDHQIKFGVDYQSQKVFNLFGRDQFGTYQFVGIDAFREGTPLSYTLFYPTQGDVNTRAASWTLDNVGLFLQDTWEASSNLTVTYGVRIDVPVARDDPAFNPAASEFFGLRNDSTINRNELVQPRFAV